MDNEKMDISSSSATTASACASSSAATSRRAALVKYRLDRAFETLSEADLLVKEK